MTFEQAIRQLQDIAVDGGEDLIPAVQAVKTLSPASVYRLIDNQQIPAIKIAGTWKTTKSLFVLFWKRSMTPIKEGTVFRLVAADNRKAQIEEARQKVLGKTS